MTLAVIAGRGALPPAVIGALPARPLVCALAGSEPDQTHADKVFELERLGGFLRGLRRLGITQICMCGSVSRPALRWWRLDLATLRLLPKVRRALHQGDDGALRIVIAIFQAAGFDVVAAHDAAPELLPKGGVLTKAQPGAAAATAAAQGDAVSQDQGARDLGQACIVAPGAVLARETNAGTDAMLHDYCGDAPEAVLFKAPKPGQDRRADLPVIGPDTAALVVAKGLSGIVIEQGGVMVLDLPNVLGHLDAGNCFLWVRERSVA